MPDSKGPSKTKSILSHIARAIRIFLAELLGVTIICFGIVAYDSGGTAPIPGPILVGVIFTWVVWVVGPISGAHVNPAVTIAMCLTRRTSILYGVIYWAGQLVGAILGSWLGKLTKASSDLVGVTKPAAHVSIAGAIGLEVLATFILVVAVLSVSDEFRAQPWCQGHVTVFPFAFGATLTLLAGVFGPLTGGSMNPARSIGPAIVQAHFEHLWIYVVSPLLGALLAVVVYEMVLSDGASVKRLKAWFTDRDFDRTRNYNESDDSLNQSHF